MLLIGHNLNTKPNFPSNFQNIKFPASGQYSSDGDHIPLEFYETAIPMAQSIDMVLGYFSTNAIRTLSMGFAEFIYNGGSMRIVTNHELTEEDKQNLLVDNLLENEDIVIDILGDIALLKEQLGPYGQHFFDCLKYLISKNRLTIVPVMHKPGTMSHYKKIILSDGESTLYVHGSANFTTAGLIKNGESITVDKSWGSDTEVIRIENELKNFDQIFKKEHHSYLYLDPEEVISVIKKAGNSRTELELLEQSVELRNMINIPTRVRRFFEERESDFRKMVEQIRSKPIFPNGLTARPYQMEAYQNWLKNGKTGLFAMATGTGKTVTAMNSALMEYQDTGHYYLLVLVPSTALLDQWEGELRSFNFNNILKVGGGNDWQSELADYCSNFKYDIRPDLAIIAINASFVSPKFQKYYKIIQKEFLLIADEAHNLGSPEMRSVLASVAPDRRIGLSATPKRVYDPEGTQFLNEFFKDDEPYTYNFSMEKALAEGRLTNYYYYPRLVYLENDEQEEYVRISKELSKYFDFEAGSFKDHPSVEILLQERKRIIHRATAKIPCFTAILRELKSEGKLHYMFVYVPEGTTFEEKEDGEKLIHQFIRKAQEFDDHLRLASYTSEDYGHSDILKGFAEGRIDIVFAMKMLDEGVDVPRAEVGIFASSTGNPRQFIQRRGRLLRTHKDKTFATIYDMIVVPKSNIHDPTLFKIERNLLRSELIRVAYFASLSMNFKDSKSELDDICARYDLDIDELILDLKV